MPLVCELVRHLCKNELNVEIRGKIIPGNAANIRVSDPCVLWESNTRSPRDA